MRTFAKLLVTHGFRLGVLCDNLDEHDEEHLGLGLQLCVELLEEQEDDAGAAERQRELGAIRERLDEEGAQVVAQSRSCS